MLIGTVLNVVLYGITIVQVYLYHNSSKRDSPWIQGFIYFLFFGDTVQTVFTVVYMYKSLITHFGDTVYLETGTWVFATDPALTGILAGLVQGFFAWRVRVLTGSLMLVFIILLCAASSFLMGIATAIAIGIVPRFVEFQKFKIVVIIWLVSASFADLLITSSLVIHLKKHRTGFSGTDTHVDRIIRLTVQTGLVTAIWALVDLTVYLLDPTGMHLIFNFPLSKLYTNSLMSSLNARRLWQYDGDNDVPMTRDNANVGTRMSTLKANVDLSLDRERHIPGTEVFVHVESHQVIDPLEKTNRMH
ncbi:hypothetical protein Hypma_000714 [Hypsizygus marmoreus]|uniref:DUF6534 domain-containing protein n=1 Tax=Hypsizygus marmoreus TaxID=39966 RepID=A0A369J733_HYPMA|nr:hypothetical protein Hypma_000714 [Hypsizygus marmoreus]